MTTPEEIADVFVEWLARGLALDFALGGKGLTDFARTAIKERFAREMYSALAASEQRGKDLEQAIKRRTGTEPQWHIGVRGDRVSEAVTVVEGIIQKGDYDGLRAAQLQASERALEAAREDHANCEALRRQGRIPHPCKLCDALAALASPAETDGKQ